ncbi:hypothetical protein FG05_35370 [Fusarium graminearum]|nr:hypothetical protein FG05_35370 [Fusarium graminearum]
MASPDQQQGFYNEPQVRQEVTKEATA